MTNEKKLVIKINCQSPQQETNHALKDQHQLINVWNVKRIVIAGLVLLLTIGLLVSLLFTQDDTQIVEVKDSLKSALNTPNNLPLDKENIRLEKKNKPVQINSDSAKLKQTVRKNKADSPMQSITNSVKESQVSLTDKAVAGDGVKPVAKQNSNNYVDGLARAQLTAAIKNKEPVGKVKLPLKVDRRYATGIYYFTELRGMKGKKVYHEWLYKGSLIYKRRINILGNRWRAHTRKMMQYKAIGSWQVKLINEDGVLMHDIKFEVIG